MKPSTRPATATGPALVLDAATLGRPVHLIDRFAARWRADLAEWLRLRLNLRYRAHFDVGAVQLRRLDAAAAEAAWLGFAAEPAPIHCTIDRELVLSLLAYRYGDSHAAGSAEGARETATEERLAQQWGSQWTALLARRLTAGLGRTTDTPATMAFGSIGRGTPPGNAWLLEAQIEQADPPAGGRLRFAVPEAWMIILWESLAPDRDHGRPRREPLGPLPSRLSLRLVARLLQKDLPLGDLADLKVGDVIPISLGAADVMVDDSRLFTATVAEHQGRLCLTSFADAD